MSDQAETKIVSVYINAALILSLSLLCRIGYTFNLTIEPSISANETYSDNINLADDGFEDDDFVSSLNPEITIHNKSRIHEGSLNYVLQKIHYFNLQRTDSFNSLNTQGEFEFFKERLFTEYNVKNGQQNVSNTGVIANDNLSLNSNRQNVLSYNIHPYLVQPLGVYAFFEAGYETNEIFTNNNNSVSDKIILKLDHGTMFNRILWDFDFTDENIENDFGNKTIFRNLTGSLKYLLTRKFALTSAVGYDDNEFASSEDISGLLWNAGFEWNPSRRTSFAASVGERYFGTDYKMNISYTSRKFRFLVEFNQTPQTTRNNLLEQQVFNLNDIFGEPFIDPDTGLPANINVLVPQQTNEVLINKRFRIVANYDYRKTFVNMELTVGERDFQLTNDTDETLSARLDWVWDIGPTLQSDARLYYLSQDLRTGLQSDQTGISLNIIKNLSPYLDINGGMSHTLREVDSGSGNYKETRAFVGLTRRF